MMSKEKGGVQVMRMDDLWESTVRFFTVDRRPMQEDITHTLKE